MTIKYSSIRHAMMASVALTGMTAVSVPTVAQAQALQPVVDVCTGLELNDSVLQQVINGTVVPTASAVESIYNSLLTVAIVAPPLLSLSPLRLGIADTTAALASGDPVSLAVLDTNGNVVAPGNCNLTADGYALNTPGGIAIGGNQITGLGAGTPATAGELDAIAFGNGAITAVGATGAVALGTNARVDVANSVALGAGSIADRGALTGYTAYGITGPVNSVGSVSIGAAGAERQLTNVAPGTAATDAATVGQVQGAIAANNADAVRYTDATHTTVALDGPGGTRVTGVAAGALSAGSTDAVNGSQLFATNQQVAANTGNITTLQGQVGTNTTDIANLQGQVGTNTTNVAGNTTAITNLQGQVGTNTTDIANLQGQVGTNTTNIAANTANIAGNTTAIANVQGQVGTNTTNIANLQAGVTANTTNLAALDDAAVKYDDATHGTVTFDGPGGTRLTNLAQGAVTATSADAVTGAQLFATNQAIAAATGSPGLALTYDDATLATATLGGAAGTTVDNVAAGNLAAGSMQAVNGSQLFATNQQVAANTGNIGALQGQVGTNTTDIATLQGQVGANTTNISAAYTRLDNLDASVTSIDGRVANNTSAITNIDGRVTANTTQLAAVQAQVDNIPVGYVSNADGITPSATPTDTAAFAGASGGTVRVTNVADGTLAAGSTDAVNGSQLAATNAQVAQNRADIVTISATIGAGSAAPLQYSNAGTPTVANGGTPTQDVTLVGANAGQPVRLHNVANGVAGTDAVNLGQLQTAMTQVQQQVVQGLNSANAYTDLRIAEIGFDLKELRQDAFSGTAAAMAMTAIPQTMTVGESMIGGAVGHYRGETAFGFGFSTTAGDRVVVKASGTIDTNGKGGVAAGAGFAF